MAGTSIRDAVAADFAVIAAIAEAGESEADESYLTFVATTGSLRVAVGTDGDVLGFGGVVGIGNDTSMLTDLFVAPSARGDGVGGRLLADLLDGRELRMTFSSKHAAAVPAYVRAGMAPSWRLLYLRGTSDTSAADGIPDTPAPAPPWRSGRPEFAAYFERRGGAVLDNAALRVDHDGTNVIARLQDQCGAAAFDAVLALLPTGSTVTCCSPEHSPVAARALERGFEVFDHDIFCCSPGVALADDLHCLDPGLC